MRAPGQPALAASAALVLLTAACTGGTVTVPAPPDDVATLEPAAAEPGATPLRADLLDVPVYLVVPRGQFVTADYTDGWLEVQSGTGSVSVTVLVFDSVFVPSAVPVGTPRPPDAARVSPPPADVVAWLRRDPGLRVGEPVAARVGGLPAVQVDVTSVRPSASVPCTERGLCTHVVGSAGLDAAVLYGDTDRWSFVTAPGGRRVAVRVRSPKQRPETVREQWQPLLDSLVIG